MALAKFAQFSCSCMTSRRPSRRLPRLLLLVVIRSVRSSASSDGGRAAAPVRAVLFDFDGSLVQSEETHRLSFSAVLKRDLDHETWYTKCVGRRPLTILEEFRHPDSPPAEELAALLKADAVSRYDKVSATDGHSDLLDDLDRAGICMAIVSSGTRAYIERVLSRLEIADRFKLIIAGDDPEVEGHHKVRAAVEPEENPATMRLAFHTTHHTRSFPIPLYARSLTRCPTCSPRKGSASSRASVSQWRTLLQASRQPSPRGCVSSRCAIRRTARTACCFTRRLLRRLTIFTACLAPCLAVLWARNLLFLQRGQASNEA